MPTINCDNGPFPTVKERFPVNIGDSLLIDLVVFSQQNLQDVLDLTNCSLTFTAHDDKISPTVNLTKTIGSGIEIIDALNGHARVVLEPDDTQVLGKFGGILYFDVKLLDSDDNLFTVAQGSFLLTPDVG